MTDTYALPVNQQPVERVEYTDGQSLDLVEIYHTIQGEGPFVGHPAVFVRTAGCTLQCPMCDTNYTKGRNFVELDSILSAIDSLSGGGTKLVVITGGEPFRQTIGPLVKQLLKRGYRVQIETNGTVYDESMKGVLFDANLTIVCSPKSRIHPQLKPHINCLKYVVNVGGVDGIGLPIRSLGYTTPPERPWPEFIGKVYLQPADTTNTRTTAANITMAVELCKKFGYILSLQLHKVCRIP